MESDMESDMECDMREFSSSNTNRDGNGDVSTDEETSYSSPYSKNFDIYSIYLSNIPEQENNIKNLNNLFSQFGKICDVNLTQTGAIIQFMKCESARRALLKRKLYDITISESWTQPEQEELVDFDDKFYLDLLNNDCLYIIYSNLMLEDQLNLAKISKRQKHVLQFYYELNKTFDYKNINFNHVTMYAIKNFLEENGVFIQNFFLYEWDEDSSYFCRPIIDFAIKYCPNIRTMKVDWPYVEFYPFEQFLELKNIETLVLQGNIISIRDDLQKPFPNLKHLNISNTSIYCNERNMNQFAKYFQNLIDLEFNLLNIESFTELDEVIVSLPMLKNLGVLFRNSDEQSIRFLNSMSKSHLVNSLESLKIGYEMTEGHMDEIKKFKNLKILNLVDVNSFTNRAFWITIDHLIKCNLEELKCDDFIHFDMSHDFVKEFCRKIIDILQKNNYSKLFTVVFAISTLGPTKRKLVLDITGIVKQDYYECLDFYY